MGEELDSMYFLYEGKAREKWVLKKYLKKEKDENRQMSRGNSFQSLRATTEKVLSSIRGELRRGEKKGKKTYRLGKRNKIG